MIISSWLINNYLEVFGAVTGIIYVFLEIRQTKWLWPVGIVTSAVYIWVFLTSKFYADMSLQVYYLAISVLGWYWWTRGEGRRGEEVMGRRGEGARERGSEEEGEEGERGRRGEEVRGRRGEGERERGSEGAKEERERGGLQVTRLVFRTGMVLAGVFVILYIAMYLVLSGLTDSPVPVWDAFITSLSIVATWMLARKIYEHWMLWIVVNFVSSGIFFIKGLYPTVVLYIVYGIMSFAGLVAWRKTIRQVEKS